MTLAPYTGHKAPSRLRCDDSTELGKLDYRLRLVGEDLMIDAADMLKVIAKERDAVRDELAAEKAKNIAMTADRNRLADKLRTINELLEPQAWAEGSRNRTLIMAAMHGVEVKV